MRICLIYDCLYPHTVGGAERWYRNLAERLVADGHEVTYLTLRQWDRGDPPEIPGVRVRAVGPRFALYGRDGRRRILPPVVFGLGVLWHLMRHGRDYDAVHTASFPYFSLLAAALARRRAGFRLVVDWHEVWSDDYWTEYLGPIGGKIGSRVQRLCGGVAHTAICFSSLHAGRLRALGFNGSLTVLRGEYVGPASLPDEFEREPLVVFAGRHIPEKQVPALIPALKIVRASVPDLRAEIYGDGPERATVEQLVQEASLEDCVTVLGFVGSEVIEAAMSRATCLVLPSRREGYGLVVVEAAARATPSVVIAGPDNAAVELVSDGVNGFVARGVDAQEFAASILRVFDSGKALRRRTGEWFHQHLDELTLDASLRAAVGLYTQAEAEQEGL